MRYTGIQMLNESFLLALQVNLYAPNEKATESHSSGKQPIAFILWILKNWDSTVIAA